MGGRDEVVAEFVARACADRFSPGARPQIVTMPDFDHHCCRVAKWPLPGT